MLLLAFALAWYWLAEMHVLGYCLKLLLFTLLASHYFHNQGFLLRGGGIWIAPGLLAFALAFLLILQSQNGGLQILGWVFLFLAKLFWGMAFIKEAQWDVDKMLLMMLLSMLFGLTVLYFLYDLPEQVFVPACLLLVQGLIFCKLAGFRTGVSVQSYWQVVFGSVLLVLGENLLLLYPLLSFRIFIVPVVSLIWGAAAYLLIRGLLRSRIH